ncbi:hypothetical protein [Amycolatopsis sp. NPDC051372]|uniref:hypothetical protein n=1 Tax=Amycolatopsis sp. NPDC051372 TaxID=3155669 RepID=UPI003420EF21
MAGHPTATTNQPADHTHVPGAPYHDDHLCDAVLCSICGIPGRVLDDGTWADLDLT